jgi:hypothetical protein
LGQLQDDLNRNFPSSEIDILAINEAGQDAGNEIAAAINDLPLLQDVDANSDNDSDVWESWWAHDGEYNAATAWRDVQVIDADGNMVDVRNLTSNDLRVQENYDALRETIVQVATASRNPLSPWQNRIEPMDVTNDGFVSAIDALRIINRINSEGAGELPGGVGVDNFYDVSGDNFVTSLDVLRVIRQINIFSLSGSGEPEVAAAVPPPVSSNSVDAYFATSIADQDDDHDDERLDDS